MRFARILNGRELLGAKAPKAAALIRDHPPSKIRSGHPAREADSAQNRLARGSAAADPNSLLAGNFFLRGRRSVPESLAMSWRCWLYNPPVVGARRRGTGNFQRPEQVVIRRFRNGTGKEQVGKNRARGRARPGCKTRPGFPSPTGVGCACEGSDESAPRRSCEEHPALVHQFLKASRWRPWPLASEMLELNRQDMIRVLETLH